MSLLQASELWQRFELSPEQHEAAVCSLSGPRGFLGNYPEDVVALFNGYPVTKGDILDAKRRKQARRLVWKLEPTEPVVKPCYVWVFDNGPILPYGGSWLYVKTLKRNWQLGPKYSRGPDHQGGTRLTMKIMRLFPCGYLPMIENFGVWKQAFVKAYHRPTKKRPKSNGLALAQAVISSSGQLLDIKYIGEK